MSERIDFSKYYVVQEIRSGFWRVRNRHANELLPQRHYSREDALDAMTRLYDAEISDADRVMNQETARAILTNKPPQRNKR